MLFGINQGSTFDDLRIEHMKQIAEVDCDGYAIGGLAVGEPAPVMYHIIEQVEPYMPKDKPRYLMGVGTPVNIIEAVYRGVDLFDCVMPSRNARHGHLFTWQGIITGLPAPQPRLYPPPAQGGRDAWNAFGGHAQPLLLQYPHGEDSCGAGRGPL